MYSVDDLMNVVKKYKFNDVIDLVKRKQNIYNSEMKIDDEIIKITKSSHLQMKDERMYIQDIKIELTNEYFLVTFDNGEYIHYDYYGKAYLSLDPKSKLYKLRLSRYDINKII